MRRFVHSFWTEPCRNNKEKLKKYFTYFATSMAYIKQHGLPIVIHTDSYGKELFSKLPYDAIYTTLDNIPKDINSKFFAYGKFLANEQEDLGCVHIDGDVFIENKELANKILNFEGDLITQNIEEGRTIQRFYRKWDFDDCKDIVNKYLPMSDIDKAYNCGIVGFNNQQLKNDYINGYINLVNELKGYNFESPFAIPDLICEQMFLYYLSPLSKPLFNDNINKEMKENGYLHVIGPNKMSDNIVAHVENKLNKINKKIYNICQEI